MKIILLIALVALCAGALLVAVAGLGRKRREVDGSSLKCDFKDIMCPCTDEEYGVRMIPCAKCKHSYKFDTKYDDKLAELGVKQQFDSNLEAYFETAGPEMTAFCLNEMATAANFKEFMKSVFLWHDTPEKEEFWLKISRTDD